METLTAISNNYKKTAIPQIKSGDTVRVHQTIREGGKQRVQVFEGVVIRTDRPGELSAAITVRRIASGVGVEKSFLLHSPNLSRVEIVRRAKVRRNYLSYLRARRGKSARLAELGFDRVAVNVNASAAQVGAADEVDQEVTEIDSEQVVDAENEVVASTDEAAAAENRDAAQADATTDPDSDRDEAQLPAQEVEQGIDKAEESA